MPRTAYLIDLFSFWNLLPWSLLSIKALYKSLRIKSNQSKQAETTKSCRNGNSSTVYSKSNYSPNHITRHSFIHFWKSVCLTFELQMLMKHRSDSSPFNKIDTLSSIVISETHKKEEWLFFYSENKKIRNESEYPISIDKQNETVKIVFSCMYLVEAIYISLYTFTLHTYRICLYLLKEFLNFDESYNDIIYNNF